MNRDSLTELQLDVMKAIWQLGEASAGEVLTALTSAGRELAPTTVATLLQRLSKQGWLKCRKVGRQLLYRAQVKEQEAASSALQRLVRGFFGGSVSALAAQLLESEQLTEQDLAEMRRLIRSKGGGT